MFMFLFGKKWHTVLWLFIMQKEDLIKRIRLIAVITTAVFVFLVVTLLIQFGFIAHYHTEIKRLQDQNAEMQRQLDGLEKEEAYTNGEYGIDQRW